jgi:hypothetical protein
MPRVILSSKPFKNVVADLRAWGGVALVGAGLSLEARFPDADHLIPLVRHALDQAPAARAALARELGLADAPSVALLADDPRRILAAWRAISRDGRAREALQLAFVELDRDRSDGFSVAHDALAQLVHHRFLEMVISMNWDTQIERAYAARYGGLLQPGWLEKPHGDALHPELPWILPTDAADLPAEIGASLDSMVTRRPRILLIVGYAEGDEEIASDIIKPLSTRWRVVRILPNATGRFDLPSTAEAALTDFVKKLTPGMEEQPWRYVLFDRQRDIGAALLGEGLGPNDVSACPTMPVVGEMLTRLELTHSVVLRGESGIGKSISAYQAGHALYMRGFGCVSLSDPSRDGSELARRLRAEPRPTVAIVDDAHMLPVSVARILLAAAGPSTKIILVGLSGWGTDIGGVTQPPRQVVDALARTYMSRKGQFLPLVSQLDRRVGDGYLDEPYESRLAIAGEAEYAWQFNFILTGGWNRIRQKMAELRETDGADLLMVAVAAAELLQTHPGIRDPWLDAVPVLVGRDPAWLHRTLNHLSDQRLIHGHDALKCPHPRLAQAVVSYATQHGDPAVRAEYQAIIRNSLLEHGDSLRGQRWILFEARIGNHPYKYHELVDSELSARLAASCWSAPRSRRRDAFLLLDQLSGDALTISHFRAHRGKLSSWLRAVNGGEAYAAGQLINTLGHADPDFTSDLIGSLSAPQLASTASATDWASAYAWGHLLGRLAWAGPREWVRQMATGLDSRRLTNLAATLGTPDLSDFDELSENVYYLREDIAEAMLVAALPGLARAINDDPNWSLSALSSTLMFTLGYPPHFLRHRAPRPWQRRLSRQLARALNPGSLATALSIGSRREWERVGHLLEWLAEVDAAAFRRVVTLVDWQSVERTAERMWTQPPHELLGLLTLAVAAGSPEPERLVMNNLGAMKSVDWRLAAWLPRCAIAAVERGLRVELGVASGIGWDQAAAAIGEIEQYSRAAAIAVLQTNRSQITQGLSVHTTSSIEGLETFLKLASDLDREAIRACVGDVDPTDALTGWRRWMRGKDPERRAIARLVELVPDESPMNVVKIDLCSTFPSLRRR